MPKVIFNDHIIHYVHQKNRRLKNIYIKIEKDKTILLKSPGISEEEATKILLKKGNWILKKLSAITNLIPAEITSGSIISCYDKNYLVEINRDPTIEGVKLSKSNEKLKFNLNPKIDEKLAIKLLLDKFYKSKSLEFIPERLEYWSKKTGLLYDELKFRKMKRQWGNCSFHNTITINSKASILKPEQLDYLLVHELCHTKVKNHSKKFWQEVEKHLPNYKELDKSLKQYQLD